MWKWDRWNFSFNSKQLSTLNFFKIIPLKSNDFSDSTLLQVYVLLEGFFWDAQQLSCYDLSDCVHVLQMVSLNDIFPTEKRHTEQYQFNNFKGIGWLLQFYDIPLGEDMLESQSVVSTCIYTIKHQCHLFQQFSFLLRQGTKNTAVIYIYIYIYIYKI